MSHDSDDLFDDKDSAEMPLTDPHVLHTPGARDSAAYFNYSHSYPATYSQVYSVPESPPRRQNGSLHYHGDNDDFYESLRGSIAPALPFDPLGSSSNILEYPPSAYAPFDTRDTGHDSQFGHSMPPPRAQPADYRVNLLEDADDMDPFGDDDLLFSETGEDVQRGPTFRVGGGNGRGGRIGSSSVAGGLDAADTFTPKLNYTRTVKRARLVHGHYVIDAPAPRALQAARLWDATETRFLRYLAVTCGPSNFGRFRFSLRQAVYTPPRATELLVCVTMYNEDEVLLGRTLKGVFDNIQNLSRRTDSVWGDDSWQKVTVVVVADGRAQLHPRSRKLLAALGVYQDGHAKSKVDERSVKAHVYEYTTTVGIERVARDRVHLAPGHTPVQLMLCLKERNARKINSHRWCFQAFAPALEPKVVMLLDCGTAPAPDAFYRLWNAFKDPAVAGACGEMRVALQGGRLLLNPLVAAQNFEYKISNVLDKPMELVFGFISVLPGAFSAYRWDALLNVDGQGPLEKYFKGEFLHLNARMDPDDDELELKERSHQEAGLFTSNMYLAEDRILCFELVAKRGHRYVLRYVSGATAETDAPEHLDDFVLQRRRWLNGSLFAALYSIFHWTDIWRSDHSLARKLWLQLDFYYQAVTLLVSWFSLALFFLVFRILTRNLGSPDVGFTVGKYLAVAFLWIYVACIVCTFVLAFGNTPRGTRKFYYCITVFFAVLMVYLTFAAVYLAVSTVKLVMRTADTGFTALMLFTNEKFRDLVVSMLSTYLLYAIGAVIHGQPSFMVTSFFQYLLLSPTYVNVLNIYSFCNIHDVSWGNRDVPQAKDLGTAKVADESGQLVMTVVPASEQEIEEAYLNTVEDLKVPPPPEVKPKRQHNDDSYYAFIRTITVLAWMLTNAILVAVVLATGGSTDSTWDDYRNSTIFLTVILWVVAALAAFRLVGSVLYVLQNMIRPLKWWMQKRKTV